MPVFHTKTIHSILDPVAQQVSRLMILHEDAEDGNAMPDLERPVLAVSTAVSNLVKVGKETINSCDDPLLRQQMPSALIRVEEAAKLLEEASALLKADPYSAPARKKLIGGSRGILGGTSALLLCFDDSEVRKLLRDCKKVLDYLAVAEVIDTTEDLVHFLKDLSPCLSKVSREVSAREKELTHQVHSEILVRCLDQVKTLVPILICSMKIYTHIQGGKGSEEAAENRNYLTNRMADEIHEIMRVLQLTTYDEDQSELDNLTVLKKYQNLIDNNVGSATAWLKDPVRGGLGEKSLRQILDNASKIADRCLDKDSAVIRKLLGEISGNNLGEITGNNLTDLQRACANAIKEYERSNLGQVAHTIQGRIDQARKWLNGAQDSGLGKRALALILEEGRNLAENLTGIEKSEILALCNEIEDSNQVSHKLAKLNELKTRIQNAIVNRVVEDFLDITTPLKSFIDSVLTPQFNERSANLAKFGSRAAKTAIAVGGCSSNKKLAENLLATANLMDLLTPQLVAAGRIRQTYPMDAAVEHFGNLCEQWAGTALKLRGLCDEAIESADFIKVSGEHMLKHTYLCEDAISKKLPQKMVDNTSTIARLANRVLLVGRGEADNSEDIGYSGGVMQAIDGLQNAVPIMVQDAKQVAINPSDGNAVSRWRESNRALLDSVGQVHRAVIHSDLDLNNLNINEPPNLNYFTEKVGDSLKQGPHSGAHLTSDSPGGLSPHLNRTVSPLPKWAREDNTDLLYQQLNQAEHLRNYANQQDQAPPRPPLPTQGDQPPFRPPPPLETDDEDEVFRQLPHPSQPIMVAAHTLHQEVRQWSSKDNEIVAAAKKMALLMARLSELVQKDSKGSKRELIATAKAIADSSEEVSKLARGLARECTDKRIRTNLLQVCERIPTIGTQLRILSTVKATMLGAQGSEEDREATEMLVGNAQNLMQSVKETVRAAEGASIKIRSDQAGLGLRWVRKQPWYQY